MRKLLILSLLASTIALNAQFGISIRGGMLLSSNTEIVDNKLADINNLISFNPELGLNYSFNKLSINTGFGMNTLGFYIKDIDVLNSEGTIVTNTDSYNKYSYLSIPISLSYKIGNGKIYFSPTIGFTSNILTSAKSTTGDIIDADIKTAKSFVPSLLGGLSFGYNITDKFSIDLTGRYNYSLSDYNTATAGKINSTAILLGLNYKF